MAVVTSVDKHDLMLTYFDGTGVASAGFLVEGNVPHVPEDNAPGWVCFELERSSYPTYAELTADLACRLFMDLGFTAEQVIELMEDF